MARRPRRDPTTLDVARAIADAVLDTRWKRRSRKDADDPATQAVIDTLHTWGSWFHQSDFDENGIAIFGTERKLK